MSRRAVLLANLGSPESPSIPDVRRYLREFLGDERVLDLAAPLRWLLLEGIILRSRPRRSAHAYSRIWTAEGSPLVVTSESVRKKLGAALGPEFSVYLAMRYGRPSIASALRQIAADGFDQVLLFPQYPHYAMSSWETVVARVYGEAARLARGGLVEPARHGEIRPVPALRIDCVQPFFDDPDYIDVLYKLAEPHLSAPHDHVLFSYHGIPERHLRKADSSRAHCLQVGDCCSICSPVQSTCYRAQCFRTTGALVERAGLDPKRHSISFQSRLAGEPWLKPFTDFELVRLPAAGVKRLVILCPSFVADCLETLEEIALTGRKAFIAAGGESFSLIPCPNDHPAYIDFLANKVQKQLSRKQPPLKAIR